MHTLNTNTVFINDQALGQLALTVVDVHKRSDGLYSFEAVESSRCLHSGFVSTDTEWLELLAEYALEEGYNEQHISAQCEELYDNFFA